MGKTTSSCFNIIPCGGNDSVDYDELDTPESKGSSDKRGWSFRKRSARHHLVRNTIVSETPPGNKNFPEYANANLQTQSDASIQEKASIIQWADEKPHSSADEKPRLSASVDSKLSEPITTRVDDVKDDVIPDEQEVLVIQTAIRAFLAQRVLLKHNNVTKLQAAVRGHLVRSHAVGTLRCIQAIVKMQALVRARRHISEKLDGKVNLGTKSEVTYTSISTLLSNGFARKLLELNPSSKSINIKCDPSKYDSAWTWLERWMSMSTKQSPQSELSAERQETVNVEHSSNLVERKVHLKKNSKSMDFRLGEEVSAVESESDENLITYDADSLDLQAQIPNISLPSNVRNDTLDSIPAQLEKSDKLHEMVPNSFPSKTEVETDHDIHSITKVSPEPLEPKGKEFLCGSRKASNPAFIAAQTKFEELSLAVDSTKVSSSFNHETEVETFAEMVPCTTDHAFGASETALSENYIPHSSSGCECGTEISISSTLDSPDRSEVGAHEFEQELEASADGAGDYKSNECSHIEDDNISIPRSDLSYSNYVETKREDTTDDANSEHFDVVVRQDVLHGEQKPENNTIDVLIEQDVETAYHVYKSSPTASPRSHITVPESQGTPSSQVSVNPKKIRSEKSESKPKGWSSSSGKRSPSNPNNDSGTRSLEQLPKDHKTGKRRNSVSSVRAEHVDQEPRDSSSSISLPSYMQATKSARAKSNSNSSPKSSPDVEAYIKKRHSLPGSNGSKGSPRIRQSQSHAQQGAKENGIQSPQDRKWQR